jgi:hypothetical protein
MLVVSSFVFFFYPQADDGRVVIDPHFLTPPIRVLPPHQQPITSEKSLLTSSLAFYGLGFICDTAQSDPKDNPHFAIAW